MFVQISKKFVKKFFYVLGLEVHRYGVGERHSFVGALKQIRNLGFTPATVIDVGAAVGKFTVQCHRVFPDSRYLLIEPLEENKEYLAKVIKTIPKAQYILAVASTQAGEVTINVHPDLVGSSLYLEKEIGLDGVPRIVPAVTIDDLCRDNGVQGPYLIKVDVQGAELDVLSGTMEILDEIEYIILEVSLFQFVEGGPQLYNVVTFMKSHGFVVYDIVGRLYRPLDDALAQIDMAFVKENGQFRKYCIYANPKQRENLTKNILSYRGFSI